jgi:phosphohistidine phosphatase
MRLYLVQHGDSKPKEEDADRPLTDQGRKDVIKIASQLRSAGIKIDKVLQSGKSRTRQTAEIITEALNLKGKLMFSEGLGPKDSIHQFKAKMDKDGSENIMVVGHLPFLSSFASLLLTGNPEKEIVQFKKGGVLSLVRTDDKWSVEWMIIPDLFV